MLCLPRFRTLPPFAALVLLLVVMALGLPASSVAQDSGAGSGEPQKQEEPEQEQGVSSGTAGNVAEGGKAEGDSEEEKKDEGGAEDKVVDPADGEKSEGSEDTAGNVADKEGSDKEVAPGEGGAVTPGGANVAERGAESAAGRPRGSGPGRVEPRGVGAAGRDLPGFAQRQPDFIPDTDPSDLFRTETRELYLFTSPLGPEQVPEGEVDDLIDFNSKRLAGRLDQNYARVVVPNGTIEGSTETKQFHIEGGLVIYYRDVTISADVADIDEKNEVARLTGDVNIVDPKYRLKTDELSIYFNDKKFQASGFVTFSKVAEGAFDRPNLDLPKKERLREYFAAQQFELFCKELYYDWDSLEMTALSSVRLVHPSFNGTMERLDYNDETKEYVIEGNVILEVTNYDWIFTNKLVEAEDEQKVRSIARQNTKITCDRLVYSEETAVAEFYSLPGKEVSFDQTARSITANYIEVNDNTKDFYAEGTEDKNVVFYQVNGNWLIEGGLIQEDGIAPEIEEMLAGEVTTNAKTLAYNFDRKRLELNGKVTVLGSGKSLQADTLVQDETSKYFLLQGNVVLVPDLNGKITAAQVFVDTENDVITFVGLVQGRIKSDDLPATDSQLEEPGGTGIQIQPGVFQAPSGIPSRPGQGNVAER